MISRRTFVLAMVAVAGCSEDVPTLEVTGTALVSVDVAPPDDHVPGALGHYRWELLEAPPTASQPAPSEETAEITFIPRRRGVYVYSRWFVDEVAEVLSYHVVANVVGAAPTALVVGPSMTSIGEGAMFDSSTSTSPEQLALTFQWRLAVRPESSTTEVADSAAATLVLVPDVAGDYWIELRVFDGELWSQPATTRLAAR